MKRRDLLKSAAGATALPAFAQHEHTAGATNNQPSAPPWKPKLFDAHQLETVTVLAELIIPATDTPGAREARVHEYIDLMLHDGPAEPRADFIKGLGWLDGYALRLHNEPFVRCSAVEQRAMLTALSRFTTAAEAEPDLSPGVRFFSQMKMLTIDGYYTTRIGIGELNKGGRVPGGFGCKHDEHGG